MVAAITDAAGLSREASRAVVVACTLESIAKTVAEVFDQLGGITDARLFGGGAQLPSFVRRLGSAARIPVATGPVEAAALGNAMVQGVALGVFADLADARRALAMEAATAGEPGA
jgi:rhamnulokinase